MLLRPALRIEVEILFEVRKKIETDSLASLLSLAKRNAQNLTLTLIRLLHPGIFLANDLLDP
jgi:hypothetical protein